MTEETSSTNEPREYPDIESQRAELHRVIDCITDQSALWALTVLTHDWVPPTRGRRGGPREFPVT